MTEKQFHGLLPIELTRIPPEDLTTSRLAYSIELLSRHRLLEDAERFYEVLLAREDAPEVDALDRLRGEFAWNALSAKDLLLTERMIAEIDDPKELSPGLPIALAVLRRSPDAIDMIEELARQGLEDPSSEEHHPIHLCAGLCIAAGPPGRASSTAHRPRLRGRSPRESSETGPFAPHRRGTNGQPASPWPG